MGSISVNLWDTFFLLYCGKIQNLPFGPFLSVQFRAPFCVAELCLHCKNTIVCCSLPFNAYLVWTPQGNAYLILTTIPYVIVCHFGCLAHLLVDHSERACERNSPWVSDDSLSAALYFKVHLDKILGHVLFFSVFKYLLFGIKHYCQCLIVTRFSFPHECLVLFVWSLWDFFPPDFSSASPYCLGVGCSGSVFPSTWCVPLICSVRSFLILSFREIKVLVFCPFGFFPLETVFIALHICQFCLGSSLYVWSLNLSRFFFFF